MHAPYRIHSVNSATSCATSSVNPDIGAQPRRDGDYANDRDQRGTELCSLSFAGLHMHFVSPNVKVAAAPESKRLAL